MRHLVRFWLLISVVVFSSSSFACQFDTDCSVGSKCTKDSPYDLYGICTGGMNPGNANDSKPIYNPLDLNTGSWGKGSDGDATNGMDEDGTYGDKCSFDVECGVGSRCVKSAYSLYGVCK